MSAPQCWAYNKQRQRCEQAPGHDDDHRISVAWTDDECYDPSVSTPVPTTWSGGVTTTLSEGVVLMNDAGEKSPTDICFGCDCPRVLHTPDGCAAHSCRTFID